MSPEARAVSTENHDCPTRAVQCTVLCSTYCLQLHGVYMCTAVLNSTSSSTHFNTWERLCTAGHYRIAPVGRSLVPGTVRTQVLVRR